MNEKVLDWMARIAAEPEGWIGGIIVKILGVKPGLHMTLGIKYKDSNIELFLDILNKIIKMI